VIAKKFDQQVNVYFVVKL